VSQVRALQEHREGDGPLGAVEPVAGVERTSAHAPAERPRRLAYIRTWTDSSVRSSDVAKWKASMPGRRLSRALESHVLYPTGTVVLFGLDTAQEHER